MTSDSDNKRRWYRLMALVSIVAVDLVGSVTVMILGSNWLVNRYALHPVLIAVSAALGFFVGIYQMTRHLKALERADGD
jgi:hypothetical protein